MGSESESLCLDELPDRLSSPSRTKLSAVAIMWLPPENAEPNQTKDTMEQCGELNGWTSGPAKRTMGLHNGSSPDFDVLVIGSGFAGLCLAIHLKRAGKSCLILERGPDVGGTWRVNTYPGCACDIPSHLYSFSFELNPRWTRMYPTQAEILEYLRDCADKYGLRPLIRFHSEVREAVFDETANIWHVRIGRGETITGRVVVSAMGSLNRPASPRIPGLERFHGRAFHSSEWDHSFNLRGKRVAVIGTGASAVQIVPQIAPSVEQLHVFQRTAHWILPKLDRPIRTWERNLFQWLPGYMRMFRTVLYWCQEMLALGFIGNPALMKLLEQRARKHLVKSVPDPVLREKLTPNFLIGCKRILISNDYLPSLCRSNVELVTDAIAQVRERSIVTADGTERPVDALVYATGFRATDLLSPVRFVGRGGIALDDKWREELEAFWGVTVAGYPNLFFLMGPNTQLGHNSIVFMIEAQVHYVMQCLKLMHDKQVTALDVRPAAQAQFNRSLQERMKRTVFASGCKSWYLDAQGKNSLLWPGFSFRYWMRTRRVKAEDYAFANDSVAEPEPVTSH